jgi:hypothetical protein
MTSRLDANTWKFLDYFLANISLGPAHSTAKSGAHTRVFWGIRATIKRAKWKVGRSIAQRWLDLSLLYFVWNLTVSLLSLRPSACPCFYLERTLTSNCLCRESVILFPKPVSSDISPLCDCLFLALRFSCTQRPVCEVTNWVLLRRFIFTVSVSVLLPAQNSTFVSSGWN